MLTCGLFAMIDKLCDKRNHFADYKC